ncbi:MAG: discoidin domain-containing protein, partial [Chloroflexi bacterium]
MSPILRALLILMIILPLAFSHATPALAACGTTNIALNKSATSSSNEAPGTTPNLAVDGNLSSRWSSGFSDPQWIRIDLGATYSICRVVLRWETAYATAYQIQVSNNGTSWTTIYSTTTGDGGVDDLTVSGSGRYIRMYGTARATPYGYSLWEFEVYADTGGPTATSTRTNTPMGPTSTPTRTATSTGCGSTSIALNRPATSSSNESAGMTPSLAVDGNTGTRWSSTFSDPQWIQIDL